MAVAIWGEPRVTRDVDFTLALLPDAAERVLAAVAGSIKSAPENPVEFIKATGMLAFTHTEGITVDLLFGTIAFAFEAVERAVTIQVRGVPVQFCSPEDLVLQKVVSYRGKDLIDLEHIMKRRRKTLDRDHLEPRIRQLAFLLEQPEIYDRYRKLIDG